eukprot:1159996-Pelagomonas_calceolata.AAC.1
MQLRLTNGWLGCALRDHGVTGTASQHAAAGSKRYDKVLTGAARSFTSSAAVRYSRPAFCAAFLAVLHQWISTLHSSDSAEISGALAGLLSVPPSLLCSSSRSLPCTAVIVLESPVPWQCRSKSLAKPGAAHLVHQEQASPMIPAIQMVHPRSNAGCSDAIAVRTSAMRSFYSEEAEARLAAVRNTVDEELDAAINRCGLVVQKQQPSTGAGWQHECTSELASAFGLFCSSLVAT